MESEEASRWLDGHNCSNIEAYLLCFRLFFGALWGGLGWVLQSWTGLEEILEGLGEFLGASLMGLGKIFSKRVAFVWILYAWSTVEAGARGVRGGR